jgi:hypothetical protein
MHKALWSRDIALVAQIGFDPANSGVAACRFMVDPTTNRVPAGMSGVMLIVEAGVNGVL